MAFKLKSGNKTNFKNMGSSPAKLAGLAAKVAPMIAGKVMSKLNEEEESPAKQRLKKGGEAQDEDKIFNEKGEHVGNWVNDKKVMFTKKELINKGRGRKVKKKSPKVSNKKENPDKQPESYGKFHKKVMKDGPKTNIHWIDLGKHPNWQPYKKKSPTKQLKKDQLLQGVTTIKSPAKQTDTTYADGSKKSAREQGFSKRHTVEKTKNKYWYKINGKPVSKNEYIKYKNVPGNMEGGGKTTNDPDVYGKKASNFGRGPKTKK